MRKRIISAVIASILVFTTAMPLVQVNAAPTTSVDEARSKYDELKSKVEEVNQKVEEYDAQISSLVTKIDDNTTEIKSINGQIDSTNKEIGQAKEDISGKEEVLGQRLREIYKDGGQTSYLSMIFSAESFSDLISRISSAGRIVDLDKKVVQELADKKETLDEKVTSLDSKGKEIVKLNEDINTKKDEADAKKAEQLVVREEAKTKQDEFDKQYLATEERAIVDGLIKTCNNSGSSLDDLKNAVSQLRALRTAKQIKSPTIDAEMVSAIENAKTAITKKENEAAAAAASASKPQQQANRGGSTVSGSASAILEEAYKHLGKSYVYGSAGPNTFDCSGFTSYVYRVAAGIEIGRDTYSQIGAGREVSQSELQPGDLVFPHSGHVGIYIGDGMMIHAPHTGDVVRVSPVYSFWRARRILN